MKRTASSSTFPLQRFVDAKPTGVTGRIHGLIHGRPFSGRRTRRVLILYERNRISYASVYPFLAGARDFAQNHDAEIRLLPSERALEAGRASSLPAGLGGASHVVAQTWLTDPAARHDAMAELLSSFPAGTVTAYLDSFANGDIRLARNFAEVDLYFKKSLPVSKRDLLRPTRGDTNLTEYYGDLYGIAQETIDWHVPEAMLDRLRLAPNFLVAPGLAEQFLAAEAPPPQAGRDLDLHARLGGTTARGWYGEMRRHAERAVSALSGVSTATGTGLSNAAFLAELRRARICFSPFGYGELCWRDIEAMVSGAVLLKPDMAHLRTMPDLFRDGETYVACRWDFADLADRVAALLASAPLRAQIAQAAYDTARRYLREGGPVATYAALFEAERARGGAADALPAAAMQAEAGR